MAGFIKDSDGIWANIVPRIRVDDTGSSSDWRRPTSGWIKTASGWKQWYAGNVADPVLSITNTTTTSVTITITNYNAEYTYQNLVSTVGTVSRSTNTITVTGLTAGQAVTVSIRASFLGTPSEITQITTSSSPNQPTFGASSGTTFTQFTIPITNYNSSYTYSITTSAGTQSRSGSDITISGLSGPGASATVSVTATTPQGRSSSVGQVTRSTTSLINPTISATPQLTGFSVVIGNTQSGYTYNVTATGPKVLTITPDSGSTTKYTITGAGPSESYTIAVVGSTGGYSTPAINPTPTPSTTLSLTNPALSVSSGVRSLVGTISTGYDSTYTYTWSINPNVGTKNISGSSCTFSGLTPNTSYTISVFGTKNGYNTTTASSTNSTLTRWSTSGTVASSNYPGYTLLKFNSPGSITYNEAISTVGVAVVGGGGAGGSTSLPESTWWVASGGGGGGQVNTETINETSGATKNIALGSGGAVGGAAAGSSSYGTVSASGGGSGRVYVAQTNADWNNGATRIANASAPTSPGGPGGGGSGVVRVTPTPVSGVAGNGAPGGAPNTAGGNGYFRTDAQSRQGGGGGGGAQPGSGVAAAPPNSGNQGGTYWGADFDGGGVGVAGRNIFVAQINDTFLYAGGGGGGGGATRNGPLGGANNIHGLAFLGGGGSGSVTNLNGTGSRASTAGAQNFGAGGGGGFNTVATSSHRAGSNGGSGTVYILIPN